MDDAAKAFAAATAEHQAGRIREADGLYQQVIAADPNHAAAWHLRGLTAWQLGQVQAAIQSIERAIELQPAFVDAYNNLGTILDKQGRLNEAAECFRRAIEFDPTCVAAIGNLGNVLRQQGKLDEAIAFSRRAIELNSSVAGMHYNLAVALQSAGMNDDAAQAYRRAIELDPSHAEANNNLGLLLIESGQIAAAEACFERAIQQRPNFCDALNNLGMLRIKLGQLHEAVAAFQRALAVQPSYVPAHVNLANVLHREDRLDEAAALCQRAVAIDPLSAEAHAVYADVLKSSGRMVESIAAYQRAVELKPHSPTIHSALLYAIYFCPGQDSAAIFAEHCRWNERHAKGLFKFVHSHRSGDDTRQRLRIGYVSPHFRNHCQAFFTTPLLANHNREQFEIFCYSKTPRNDHFTSLVRRHVDHWRNTFGLADEQVANFIWRDQIDILVDLTMHMELGDSLLFARRPAPIQVCWLAYPGTTGLTAIDYRFTDPQLDPPGMFDRFYSEESFRLPHSFWCYDPLTTEPAVNRLPALDSGGITFGCLNNFCKINDGVLKLWASVMKAVPRSRLILMAPVGACRQRTTVTFEREGIDAARVTFVPFQKRDDYFATYHKIDIGLETLPYNGHTTSLDSFWMGVPVPTLVGQTVVGRAGVSLLKNLGLANLIAETPEQYVEIVSQLAADLPRLSELRAGLRQQMQQSPLMNAAQFARDVESAYGEFWRRWCEKKP